MKEALLCWKKYWGKDYCIGWGIILIFCDIPLAMVAFFELIGNTLLGSMGILGFLLFFAATCFTFAAAFTKEKSTHEASSWRYFTCDEQGNPKVVSIESTPKPEKQIELRVTNKQEAQDALDTIETLHGANRISIDDYIRVKKQLTEYLELAEDDEVNAQKEERKPMSEEKQIYKAYQRSLMRQLKGLKAAMDEKNYTTAERLINEMIEDIRKNIQD